MVYWFGTNTCTNTKLNKTGKGCPIAAMTIGEMAVRRSTYTRQRCNWGGAPLLFLTAFTFPCSDENQAPIYRRVNRERYWKIWSSISVLKPGPSARLVTAFTTPSLCLPKLSAVPWVGIQKLKVWVKRDFFCIIQTGNFLAIYIHYFTNNIHKCWRIASSKHFW